MKMKSQFTGGITMKVMVYEGPRTVSLAEVPDFPLQKNQVRTKTLYTGLSHGTEMNVYRGVAPFFKNKMDPETKLFVPAEQDAWTYPIRSCDPGVWYMGYANVGEVIEIGADVKEFALGDIVFSNSPHQSQVVLNAEDAVKLPEGLKPEQGVFFANLITSYNAILDSEIKLGDKIAVSGLGVLGQMASQMVKMSGALEVYGIDLFEKRREAALANGVDKVFDPTAGDVAMQIRKLTNKKGPDSVIESSGSVKGLHNAIRVAAPDTTITALSWYQGACSDLNLAEEFHHNRVAIRCSQMVWINPKIRHMWDTERRKQTCVELIQKLKLGNLITDIIPYDKVASAYELVDKHPADIIQVVLKY